MSAYNREQRLALIRRAIKQFLRSQQYRDFEGFVEQIATQPPPTELAADEQPLALPR